MPMPPGPVIIVDDDEAVRRSLKFALELEGLDVLTYQGGAEILAASDLPATGCLVVDYYTSELPKYGWSAPVLISAGDAGVLRSTKGASCVAVSIGRNKLGRMMVLLSVTSS